jgi:hypothetical protein
MPDDFEKAWVASGKYGNRIRAVKAWDALKADGPLIEKIQEDADWRFNHDWGYRPDDKVPHFSTYLNGAGWDDRRINKTAMVKPEERSADEVSDAWLRKYHPECLPDAEQPQDYTDTVEIEYEDITQEDF